MCGHNFHAGELGPGTIVGSAAFNMFVILGVCVLVIPDGESRKIKHLRVFFITAFWSIFAYIWLYLILAVISPGIVEVGLPIHPIFFSHLGMMNVSFSDGKYHKEIGRFTFWPVLLGWILRKRAPETPTHDHVSRHISYNMIYRIGMRGWNR